MVLLFYLINPVIEVQLIAARVLHSKKVQTCFYYMFMTVLRPSFIEMISSDIKKTFIGNIQNKRINWNYFKLDNLPLHSSTLINMADAFVPLIPTSLTKKEKDLFGSGMHGSLMSRNWSFLLLFVDSI